MTNECVNCDTACEYALCDDCLSDLEDRYEGELLSRSGQDARAYMDSNGGGCDD